MKKRVENRMRSKSFHNQQGGTKIYALVALLVVFLLIHAGWNYLPAIYQCENFKSEMQTAAIQIVSMPRSTSDPLANKLKKRLRLVGNDNGVPPNALIEVTEANGTLKAHVRFVREIHLLPFGLYKYQYQFDNTAIG